MFVSSENTDLIFLLSFQDSRFRLFPNGTLRINNVEVYDGLMYGCETRTVGGQLSGIARVIVLGKLSVRTYIQEIIHFLQSMGLESFPRLDRKIM